MTFEAFWKSRLRSDDLSMLSPTQLSFLKYEAELAWEAGARMAEEADNGL
jgi:hypothetical protein